MTTGGQKARLSGTGFLYDRRGSGEKRGSYVDVTPLRGGELDRGSWLYRGTAGTRGVDGAESSTNGGLGYTAERQETGLRISGGLGLKGWRGSQSSGGSSPLQTALVYG
ncbi:hypothetical protein R3P38DRAFT_2767606 [Favolaschia claudopus]|uniref:Uncharacterized protein n=1 Tax=Favolaschia claudopus TaxID=2862362 RepID=A0AAW0CXM1_9AGAR